jgi:predicted lipoprotein
VRRSALLLVTAFAVGLLAAFAASCAGNGVKGGLPQSSADDLKAQISDVQEFVDRGDCDGIDGQLRQVQQAIDNLPESTDEALVANLRQGAEQLQATAITACNSPTETTTQTQTQTTPQETVTEAIPTVTATVPTTPPETTPTVPPETTPTVPTETTPPPAATVPGDTSGGAGVTP